MMTSSTSNPVAPESSAPRRRNNHHIADAYLDLMKPDESLTDQHDATERRKIQNRLAQRAYSMQSPLSIFRSLRWLTFGTLHS